MSLPPLNSVAMGKAHSCVQHSSESPIWNWGQTLCFQKRDTSARQHEENWGRKQAARSQSRREKRAKQQVWLRYLSSPQWTLQGNSTGADQTASPSLTKIKFNSLKAGPLLYPLKWQNTCWKVWQSFININLDSLCAQSKHYFFLRTSHLKSKKSITE